ACVFLALLIAHRLFVSHWPAANWAHVIAAPRENDCVAPALRAGLAQHQPPCFPLADNSPRENEWLQEDVLNGGVRNAMLPLALAAVAGVPVKTKLPGCQ